MGIVGFNFSKISLEREKFLKGKINVNNNVAIKDVKKSELSIAENQKAVDFEFEFKAVYEPDLAKIELCGEVVYVDEDKKIKEILDQWKKSKSVNKETMTEVLNNVLARCNVEAIILSRDANLPSPIPLPRLGDGTDKEQ